MCQVSLAFAFLNVCALLFLNNYSECICIIILLMEDWFFTALCCCFTLYCLVKISSMSRVQSDVNLWYVFPECKLKARRLILFHLDFLGGEGRGVLIWVQNIKVLGLDGLRDPLCIVPNRCSKITSACI